MSLVVPDTALDRSLLSVVVPVFNEEAVLPELLRRLVAAVELLGFARAEILLVSDGSTDRSEAIIAQAARRDGRVQGIFLSRNFGHQAAVSTGLAHAKGSVVAVLDGDLQDPPEVLADLVEALEAGADVAYGVRRLRKEHRLKRAAYFLFYRLLRRVASIEIPLDSGDFCCLRRPVVDALLALPERNRFLRGLRAWVGFRQVGVAYERAGRYAGEPKFTFRKLVALAYDGIFSFTTLPVRVIQFLGFVVSSAAIVVAAAYFVWAFLAPQRFPIGFASLIISIWFFGGVQLLCLGLIGEYVARACDEGRRRPVAIVREIVAGGCVPHVAIDPPATAVRTVSAA